MHRVRAARQAASAPSASASSTASSGSSLSSSIRYHNPLIGGRRGHLPSSVLPRTYVTSGRVVSSCASAAVATSSPATAVAAQRLILAGAGFAMALMHQKSTSLGPAIALSERTQDSEALATAAKEHVVATSPVDGLMKLLGISSDSENGDSDTVDEEKERVEEEEEKKRAAVGYVPASEATSKDMESWPPVRDSETAERVEKNLGGGSKLREGKVTVELDEETLSSLPVMPLDEVMKYDGLRKPPSKEGLLATYETNETLTPESVEVPPSDYCPSASAVSGESKAPAKLYVTYEGIVYDVTSFAEHHPGGRELLRTAAGLDLKHFFDNYRVHSQTEKAAQWLAPLAVGRLTPEDAKRAEKMTTPEVHVEKRMKHLGRARRQTMVVAASLPFWVILRNLIRAVGAVIPNLARLLARCLPVAVPEYSPGAERLAGSEMQKLAALKLQLKKEGKLGSQFLAKAAMEAGLRSPEEVEADANSSYSVAVIGGGVAGCGAAWALKRSGFDVTLYEAREQISGNARTFDWDFSPYRGAGEGNDKLDNNPNANTIKSCVSVTAWPPLYYKNYTALLADLGVETVPMPLSWFLNSKVKGAEGSFWGADPTVSENHNTLRKVFEKDFRIYEKVERFAAATTDLFTGASWDPRKRQDTPSMYANHTGFGMLNPLNVVPLYSLFKWAGGSDLWWDVVFTPFYTASFLVDELRPFPAVFGPLIEAQIPLNPKSSNASWSPSEESVKNCCLTTCVTWKDAGVGIRGVFMKLVEGVKVKEALRIREVEVLPNGKKRVHDENDGFVDVDRVVFACPSNAIGNMLKKHGFFEEVILSTPVYADDHHPASGHMHAVMHSDKSVIAPEHREGVVKRASNYVEVTRLGDPDNGPINIENQYNFGVQTPGPGVSSTPPEKKPVMLISHALGEGKAIDPKLIRGEGNHARAHPLYSGWNVAAMLSLRLVQGKNGIYYCSNWTTPGNCHDMSILSGFICAHAIGADYPFPENVEAKKDFHRLRDLMGF